MITFQVQNLKHWLKQTIIACLPLVMSMSLIWSQQAPAAQAQPAPPKPVLLSGTGAPGTAPQPLSDADRAKLQDPLFQLVLKDHADAKTLADLNKFLKPAGQDVFVVDEHIADSQPQVGNGLAERRAVITMNGTTNNQILDQNVLLSMEFNSEQFQSPSFIEAMGWDDSSGSFNYYKLDKRQDEPTATWKFRGNSKNADLLSASSRQGTCMQCHINGAVVMKELDLPWNNWNSFSSKASYLSAGNTSWPIVNAANTPLSNLDGAESLETATIKPAITRFNERRISTLKSADGQTIVDAKRLLKPLFVTTEFNLISSHAMSALHPFSASTGSGTKKVVDVPNRFFINDQTLSALNISSDFRFATLEGKDYEHLVRQTKTTLNGQQPGDTNFAWFVPEASFVDSDWVRQIVSEQKIVPPAFALAALAIDIETPILSTDRANLWSDKILPAQFKIGPNNDLIAQVVKNLTALNPASGTPEAKFLALLSQPDKVATTVQTQVDQYVKRERDRLSSAAKPADRSNEWIRLYKLALQRREAILANASLKSLDETGGKFLMARGDLTATVAALPSATTVATNPATNPVTNPTTTRPTLRLGDGGDDVRFLQRQLAGFGLFDGVADGDFGPQTQAAVIAAQRQFKLTADGIVGAATWARLQGPIA
jgi:hypothetical protein